MHLADQLSALQSLVLFFLLLMVTTFSYALRDAPPPEPTPKFHCGVFERSGGHYLYPDTLASGSVALGKSLFRSYCGSCHASNMVANATGPALLGTEARWADYPRADLYRWVRNSQEMIAEKHPRALELWHEWGPTQMNAFPNLTDEEIDGIFAYVEDIVW